MEFFLYSKCKVVVKPTIHQNSAVWKHGNIFPKASLGKVSKSLIINFDLEPCIPCRDGLLGQTTKRPLSTLRPVNLENISNFEAWSLTLVNYKNESV